MELEEEEEELPEDEEGEDDQKPLEKPLGENEDDDALGASATAMGLEGNQGMEAQEEEEDEEEVADDDDKEKKKKATEDDTAMKEDEDDDIAKEEDKQKKNSTGGTDGKEGGDQNEEGELKPGAQEEQNDTQDQSKQPQKRNSRYVSILKKKIETFTLDNVFFKF